MGLVLSPTRWVPDKIVRMLGETGSGITEAPPTTASTADRLRGEQDVSGRSGVTSNVSGRTALGMRELVGFEMRETDAEVEYLQRLMDDTFAGANPHMTSIVTPEKRLRATQVVRYLDGIKYAAFGSVTQAGEPRVSPLDTLFVRGRFTLSTDGSAARVTNLRHNPACSLVHMVGETIAIVVHGSVEWITRDHPDHDEIQSIWSSAYRSDLYSWGSEIVLFRAEPAAMWAYAQRPTKFPE